MPNQVGRMLLAGLRNTSALDLSQHPMDTQLELLSGGERAKVALAR